MNPMRVLLGLALPALLLTGCAHGGRVPAGPAGDDASYYVLLGSGGAPLARAIVDGSSCPSIRVDGVEQPMSVRAAAGSAPERKPQMDAPDHKPADFPRLVCESQLPATASQASIGDRPLPLPPARIDRIVVIGDTGCRVKRSGGAFQRCDRDGFRFAKVAAAAAALKPDLVIHVGDYHYRESSCPQDARDCYTGSWGYGWDTWRDDFFVPARPLLRAAPWIAVRGNHEMCARAGQGWWRFLAAQALVAGQDCNETHNDAAGDFSPAYAVPIGADSQLIVLDSADAGDFSSSSRYRAMAEQIDRLARGAPFNIVLVHHPILGFARDSGAGAPPHLVGGQASLVSALSSYNPDLLPDSVQLILSGHVHVWEQVAFAERLPTQFISGISGTKEDTEASLKHEPATPPLPHPAAIESSSSWIGGFGFMSMDRSGPGAWEINVWDEEGRLMNRCRVQGRRSTCEKRQVAVTP